MPLPQSLHRISTKVRKIILCNKHYRLGVQDSRNPSNPCADKLEKPATIYKSKERERGIRLINHNIWSPLKLKTQEVSGVQLINHFLHAGMIELIDVYQQNLPFIHSGKVSKAAVVLLMGLLGMVYQAKKLLPPETSGAAEHSPVTSSRIRLKDGRYLAYRERGVPKEKAKYKIILGHGLGSSKEMNFLAPQLRT